MVTHITGRSLRQQIFFWLLVLAFFIVFLWLFSSILLPFVAGMALAYFLDPVADRLERIGLSRMMATSLILLSFVVLLALALIIVIPLLATQAADFAAKVPGYISSLQHMITDTNSHYVPAWLKGQMGNLKDNLSKFVGEGASFIAGLFVQIWASGKALIDVLSLFIITPVVAFYILLDWDNMVAKLDSWVPRDYVVTVRQLAGQMNDAIAGFVRGQGTICIVLALFCSGFATFSLLYCVQPLLPAFAHRRRGSILHPLCRLAAWPGAVGRRGAGAVLAQLPLGGADRRHLFLRPDSRRLCAAAEAGGRKGRPASGLADVRPAGFRSALRFCRPDGGGSRLGIDRRAGALCDFALS